MVPHTTVNLFTVQAWLAIYGYNLLKRF